ncbi:MAG: hypothetical protein ACLPP9_12770 [Smithella sp.]
MKEKCIAALGAAFLLVLLGASAACCSDDYTDKILQVRSALKSAEAVADRSSEKIKAADAVIEKSKAALAGAQKEHDEQAEATARKALDLATAAREKAMQKRTEAQGVITKLNQQLEDLQAEVKKAEHKAYAFYWKISFSSDGKGIVTDGTYVGNTTIMLRRWRPARKTPARSCQMRGIPSPVLSVPLISRLS